MAIGRGAGASAPFTIVSSLLMVRRVQARMRERAAAESWLLMMYCAMSVMPRKQVGSEERMRRWSPVQPEGPGAEPLLMSCLMVLATCGD